MTSRGWRIVETFFDAFDTFFSLHLMIKAWKNGSFVLKGKSRKCNIMCCVQYKTAILFLMLFYVFPFYTVAIIFKNKVADGYGWPRWQRGEQHKYSAAANMCKCLLRHMQNLTAKCEKQPLFSPLGTRHQTSYTAPSISRSAAVRVKLFLLLPWIYLISFPIDSHIFTAWWL